jgi:hypothetical protein
VSDLHQLLLAGLSGALRKTLALPLGEGTACAGLPLPTSEEAPSLTASEISFPADAWAQPVGWPAV